MASNPAQGPGGLEGMASRWNHLAKPWRVNVVLYALTVLSMVALVFELVAGDDTAPKIDVASKAPIASSTTSSSTSTSSSSSTSSTSSTISSSVPPTTRTTSRPVVTTEPEPEPEPDPEPEETTTTVEETTTTTEPPTTTTTTTTIGQPENPSDTTPISTTAPPV